MALEVIKVRTVKTKLGELVKTLRKNENLTQEELADLLGLSRITIQNLEAGKNVTIDTLLNVYQHFGLLPKFYHSIIDDINNSSEPSLY